MIIKITRSRQKNKRYTVTMDDGKKISFGYKFGNTYLDHKRKDLRDAYLKRHLANETENTLIKNLVPSPALFSAYLLWSYPDENVTELEENIKILNSLWMKKKYNKSV